MPTQATYRFGYANKRLTWNQFEAQQGWNKIDPEMRRRFKALMVDCPYDLGFGNGFRTTEQQEWTDENSAGTTVGNSYHEKCTALGYSLACDFLNYDYDRQAIAWANSVASQYGCYTLITTREPWHFQPIEVPHTRRLYRPNTHTLTYWSLPGTVKPPTYHSPWPNPTLRLGSRDTATDKRVRQLQTILNDWHMNPGVIDGIFGKQTEAALKTAQTEAKTESDGIYGPKTKSAFDSYYQGKGWGVW